MTNCINCGAPLHGNVCAYCGTEYNEDGFVCRFDKDELTGTLRVHGKEFRVYLGEVEGHDLMCGEPVRDEKGRLTRATPLIKHVFKLIEV